MVMILAFGLSGAAYGAAASALFDLGVGAPIALALLSALIGASLYGGFAQPAAD